MSEQPARASGLMEGFFSNLNLPNPDEQQKTVLNGPITLEEIAEAIGVLQSGKALGPSGFSWIFTNVLNRCWGRLYLQCLITPSRRELFPQHLQKRTLA